jgi:hypothetical protein
MIPQTSEIYDSYVPVYDVVPEEWEDARGFLVERLREITNAVNIREIGWFLDVELLSGKTLFPGVNTQGNASPQQNRQILRKVIDFGPLPNSAVKSVPHGIVVDDNFTLITLYAGAFDPIGLTGLPIPFSASTTTRIQIDMDAVNVNITTVSPRSNYTNVKVIIEYCQEL